MTKCDIFIKGKQCIQADPEFRLVPPTKFTSCSLIMKDVKF